MVSMVLLGAPAAQTSLALEAIGVGSQRELFVDH